jgi:hypothetical protein
VSSCTEFQAACQYRRLITNGGGSTEDETMNLILNKISSVAILVVASGLALATTANAQTQPTPSCPVGYWQYDTVYSNAKGEVHSASGISSQAVAVKHGGQARDWTIGALCMQTSDGDVWIFNAPASSHKSASR